MTNQTQSWTTKNTIIGVFPETEVVEAHKVAELESLKNKLEEALKYPRHSDTSQLLIRAADFIEDLQKDSPGTSYFTPHLRNAAKEIDEALQAAKDFHNHE